MRVITVARKPLVGSVAENTMAWGTGGLNIGDCRIPIPDLASYNRHMKCGEKFWDAPRIGFSGTLREASARNNVGARYPSNLILQHIPACGQDACQSSCPVKGLGDSSGTVHSGSTIRKTPRKSGDIWGNALGDGPGEHIGYGDTGTAARFFKTCHAPCPVADLRDSVGFLHGCANRAPCPRGGTNGVVFLGTRTGDRIEAFIDHSGGTADRYFKQIGGVTDDLGKEKEEDRRTEGADGHNAHGV